MGGYRKGIEIKTRQMQKDRRGEEEQTGKNDGA